MRLTRKALGAALLAGAALLCGGGEALAGQSDAQFDAQNWKPAFDPYGYFTVEGAKAMEFIQVHLALTYDWAHNPLELAQSRQGAFGGNDVVRDLHMLDLTGAIGLLKINHMGLTLGVDVPYAVNVYGIKINPDPSTGLPQSLQKNAFGDVRTQLKWTFMDREDDAIGLAGFVNISWPTGSSGQFLSNGYRLITPEFGAVVEKKFKFFRIGANVSYVYLYEDLGTADVTISDRLKYSTALEITPFDSGALKPLSFIGEFFGWTNFADPFDHEAVSPLEAGGGIKYTSTFFAELGANAGLNKGVGAPDVRIYASLGVTF
jgi:hypothetical protein